MYKWHERYSYWVIILALLYKLKIIKTNVYPSVLFALIGTFYIIYLKSKNNIKMSTSYVIYTLFIHIFPLFLVNCTFSFDDLLINLLLFFLYTSYIYFSGKNVYSIYEKGIYTDSNKNLYEILKDRDLI
jgi:hypothetical protein